eukprot:PhM_4_TR4686/c0_g2_i1/m.105985
MPDVFMVLGTMGTVNTVVAEPYFIKQNNVMVGALTGYHPLRITVHPYMINVRPSYGDEAIKMIQYLVSEKHHTRISTLFSSSAAPMDIVRDAMSNVGLKLHNEFETPIDDYDAIVRKALTDRTQSIMLLCTETTSFPFLLKFKAAVRGNASYANQTLPLFFAASNVGNIIRDFVRDNDMMDIIELYQTQIVPNPNSQTSALATSYRSAMIAAHGPSTTFDFLSMEGYVVGRLVASILSSVVGTLTRESFKETIFRTRLFAIEDVILGPYTDNCKFPTASTGRSSMCNCTQGMRLVSAHHINHVTGEYIEISESSFPMTECYTTAAGVKRPLLLGVQPSDGAVLSQALLPWQAVHSNVGNVLVLESAAVTDYVIAIVNTPRDGFVTTTRNFNNAQIPFFAGLSSVVSPSTDPNVLYLFPTLQHEIHAAAGYIYDSNSRSSSLKPSLMVFVTHHAGEDWSALANDFYRSLATHSQNRDVVVNAVTVSTVSELMNLFAANGHEHIVIIGLATSAELDAVLTGLQTAARPPNVHLIFNEVAKLWSVIESCADVQSCFSILPRLTTTSSMPLWVAAPEKQQSPFVQKYNKELSEFSEAQRRHPLTIAGFFMAKFVEQLNSLGGNDIVKNIYTVRVSALGDVALGPFRDSSDTSCTEEICTCNIGPRVLYTFNLYSLFNATNDTGAVTNMLSIESCRVPYNVPPETTKSQLPLTLGVAIPVGVVFLICCYVSNIVFRKYIAKKKVMFAPKNAQEAFSVMIVALKKESVLWERYPASMPKVLQLYSKIVSSYIRSNGCYEVKTIGTGGVLIVGATSDAVAACASQVAGELQKQDWNKFLVATGDGGDGASFRPEESETCSSLTNGERRHTRMSSSSHRISGSASVTGSTFGGGGTRSSTTAAPVVAFGIGIHCGHGRITHDEERNAYDYAGPTVDTAAIIADRAQGDQILMSATFKDNAHISSDQEVSFGDIDVEGKTLPLCQYNPTTIERRDFDHPSADDVVDSIAATLQQQSSGLTKKRVTALVLYIRNDRQFSTTAMEDIHSALCPMVDRIYEAVTASRGTVLSFVSGRLMVVFNVKQSASQAPLRACRLFEEVRCIVSEYMSSAVITGGVFTKESIIGTHDVVLNSDKKNKTKITHDIVISEVVDVALGLQRYTSDMHGQHCPLVVTSVNEPDLHVDLELECVDIARILPIEQQQYDKNKTDESTALRAMAIYCVRGDRASADADEWIYELEKKDEANPFQHGNHLFESFLASERRMNNNDTTAAAAADDGMTMLAEGLEHIRTCEAELINLYGVQRLTLMCSQYKTLSAYLNDHVVT